jgi:hypothetical protein
MKATLMVLNEPDFLQNRIFSTLPIKGVKNYGYMFAELRKQLAIQGIDLATQDIHAPEHSTLIISLDVVDIFKVYERRSGQLIYLLLNEPATYYPEVWNKVNHVPFDRVFTWDYTLADGKKYIHHYFAIDLDAYEPFKAVTEEEFNDRKLLVLMAGMFQFAPPKSGSDSLLYIRYKTLRWFGEHLSQHFDFYSRGIDRAAYRSFRGLGLLQRILPRALTDWMADAMGNRRRQAMEALNLGPVAPLEKLATIRSYRFVICYENTRTPGYVSEKIFDCLFASCVPVYLGEPSIERFIPRGCYVNRDDFATDAALSAFLMQMSYAEYAGYIAAIQDFLSGVERQKFGSEANATRVTDVLLADIAASKNSFLDVE